MPRRSINEDRVVYLVDGVRTPFLKATDGPGPFASADLALSAARALLLRLALPADTIEEVIVGCTMPSADEANIARIIALRLACGHHVPAWTVQRNCASGLQAIDNAVMDITNMRHDLVLAGGSDAMSRAPVLYSNVMTRWLAKLYRARALMDRVKVACQFRLSYLKPIIGLLRGLSDPVVGLNMGQTAENIASQFAIARDSMDRFAVQSHSRLAQAHDNGLLQEIEPIYDIRGRAYDHDNGLRRESTLEKLSQLKPFFDKKFGKVTAANSSQITDGACMVLMASEKAVTNHQLPVLGKIVDIAWAALDPASMGLGPVHAIAALLKRNDLAMKDIDYWEINEAFAGQVLACLAAMNDKDYCTKVLHLEAPLGVIDQARLNVDGGAIALGHPIGASGARITLHLLKVLQRQSARFGIASLCVGGGQGGAILVENTMGDV